jgi:hypothetical protein
MSVERDTEAREVKKAVVLRCPGRMPRLAWKGAAWPPAAASEWIWKIQPIHGSGGNAPNQPRLPPVPGTYGCSSMRLMHECVERRTNTMNSRHGLLLRRGLAEYLVGFKLSWYSEPAAGCKISSAAVHRLYRKSCERDSLRSGW